MSKNDKLLQELERLIGRQVGDDYMILILQTVVGAIKHGLTKELAAYMSSFARQANAKLDAIERTHKAKMN